MSQPDHCKWHHSVELSVGEEAFTLLLWLL